MRTEDSYLSSVPSPSLFVVLNLPNSLNNKTWGKLQFYHCRNPLWSTREKKTKPVTHCWWSLGQKEPTCNNWVWRGRSCWGPCTWPARPSALSGERQRWGGANWPRTHLRKTEKSTQWGWWSHQNDQRIRSKEAHPSSWAGDTRPACTGPLEHWITRSGPGPAGERRAVWAPAGKQPVREATTKPTWVVAVMDNTKVGTVEQLRFRRRPWDMRAGLKNSNTSPHTV